MQAADVIDLDLNYICQSLSQELPVMEGERLLITGGAGFLGYYLIQTILYYNAHFKRTKPIKLTVFDNFIRGIPAWLEKVKKEDHIVLLERDVSAQVLSIEDEFDYIIHAASIASPTYYRLNPIKTMDTNVNGLRYLLDYALERKERKLPVKSILYFSSSEIYGDPTPENIPTPETYFGHVSCTGPRACYDESKRYGETLCVNFASQHQLPIKVVRPFNNYGPGLKITDRRVIPDFANSIIQQRDIVLLSDGAPTRTFCYVADAMIGYFKALIKGRAGEPYNIGVEKPEISVADLAKLIVELAKDILCYKGKMQFAQSQDAQYLTDNPQRRCPVITKAQNELGYSPNVALEEGLKRSLIWYNENQYAENA